MHQKTCQPTVFAEALWPKASLTRDIMLVLAGSWLLALAAQIEIPLWPVPITGQTLGVLLIAALLGSRRGASSVLVYLGQGALGLPVFAGGSGGLARLAGPTGGYLAGFVATAFVVGWLSERGWDRRLATTALAMIVGNLLIYGFGLPWLAIWVGWPSALSLGLFPFIVGDLLKIALASLALPWGWALIANTRLDDEW